MIYYIPHSPTTASLAHPPNHSETPPRPGPHDPPPQSITPPDPNATRPSVPGNASPARFPAGALSNPCLPSGHVSAWPRCHTPALARWPQGPAAEGNAITCPTPGQRCGGSRLCMPWLPLGRAKHHLPPTSPTQAGLPITNYMLFIHTQI